PRTYSGLSPTVRRDRSPPAVRPDRYPPRSGPTVIPHGPSRPEPRRGSVATRPVSAAVEAPDELVHQLRGLAHHRAAGRTARGADTDLEMRSVGDPHATAPDLGDRLARADLGPDRDQG